MSESARAGGQRNKVLNCLKTYQIARAGFINSVRDFIEQEDGGVSMACLLEEGILSLLTCPLSEDTNATIQATTLRSLGQLAAVNSDIAQVLATGSDVLPKMLLALKHTNRNVRISAHETIQVRWQHRCILNKYRLSTDSTEHFGRHHAGMISFLNYRFTNSKKKLKALLHPCRIILSQLKLTYPLVPCYPLVFIRACI